MFSRAVTLACLPMYSSRAMAWLCTSPARLSMSSAKKVKVSLLGRVMSHALSTSSSAWSNRESRRRTAKKYSKNDVCTKVRLSPRRVRNVAVRKSCVSWSEVWSRDRRWMFLCLSQNSSSQSSICSAFHVLDPERQTCQARWVMSWILCSGVKLCFRISRRSHPSTKRL